MPAGNEAIALQVWLANEARAARNEDSWHNSPAQILPQATPYWYYGPIRDKGVNVLCSKGEYR